MTTPPCPRCKEPLCVQPTGKVWCNAKGSDGFHCGYGNDAPRFMVPQPDHGPRPPPGFTLHHQVAGTFTPSIPVGDFATLLWWAALAEQDKDFSEAMLISHMQGALDSERKYRDEIKALRAALAAAPGPAGVDRSELGSQIFAATDGAPGAWSIADAILAKFTVTKKATT